MTNLKRQEELTTADLAARGGNSANSDPVADPQNTQYAEDYIAANPARPKLVQSAPLSATDASATPLLSDTDIGDLRTRWSDVQAAFVDEPRRSVEQADQLVATVMQRLAEGFANERASLERQWDSGDNVSTEELRVALQRYRAFFGRLLNAA